MAGKRVLRVENIGVDLIERIASAVVIAVACRAREHRFTDVVFLKRPEHFLLIIFLDPLDLLKVLFAHFHRLIGGFQYLFIDLK